MLSIAVAFAALHRPSMAAGFDGLAPIEDAIERLELATASHPDDPDLHWAYARALSRGGQFDRAAKLMEHYARRWPERRRDVHLALGRLLFESGRTDDAQQRLELAVRSDPGSGTARFYHALALRELGRRDQARLELIESGRLTPAKKASMDRRSVESANSAGVNRPDSISSRRA